ncbi:hypothetical protein ACFY94_01510 [Streptomyces griseorubiginosus]|uniref:hypothetical protein n=1 Tax=Streptomyces griseorubiginosus TaxID=67304 RepID=UPI0036E6A855
MSHDQELRDQKMKTGPSGPNSARLRSVRKRCWDHRHSSVGDSRDIWLIGVFLVAVSGPAAGEVIATGAWYRKVSAPLFRPADRDPARSPAHPRRVKPSPPCRGHAENAQTGGRAKAPDGGE